MIEFTLYGAPSKKNSYTPGPRGFFKSAELRAALDDLESQVPGEFRDLGLMHPDISFFITTSTTRRDRDNIVTTVLDVLVKCRVLRDDNVSSCNGRLIIEPAVVDNDEDSVRVVIYPHE